MIAVMVAIPYRHRSLALLAAVLAAQVLLLAVQIKRDQQVRLIRVWTVELVSPLGRGAAWLGDGLRGGWSGYIALRHMRAENDQLRSQLDQLRLRDATLASRAAEADRLAVLLGFRDTHTEVPMLAARVIGGSPDTASHILFLNRGSHDGIRRDMGVITPDGVVGKILAVYPDTSQVLLLSDKDSGVGSLLASNRTQAPVRGSGDPMLDMEYVSNDVKVQPGDTVLTSGQDRIFPKDLPVGTVISAQTDPHGPFQRVLVRPAAHLDQLEEVLVLLSRQEFTPRKDDASAAATTPAGAPASSALSPGAPSSDASSQPSNTAAPAAAPAAVPATAANTAAATSAARHP